MKSTYDVVVIGAGPAGSLAARSAARAGASVLLVDKAVFPRAKVCGCCVNRHALQTLAEAGLGDVCRRLGAVPLKRLRLAADGRCAELPLPGGVAVGRAVFDEALAQAATDAGIEFHDGTGARLVGPGEVELRDASHGGQARAGVVVLATGLSGSAEANNGSSARVCSTSHMGFGTVLNAAPGDLVEPGTVQMCCGAQGYVGLVQLEDGRLDVAAAMAPGYVRAVGGPGPAAIATIRSAGLPVPAELSTARWRGTPTLTRRRARIAGPRLLVVGDAAGYVEPFTGEGIGWALAGGRAAGELAARGWDRSIGKAWVRKYRGLIRRRQVGCIALAALLRRPRLTRVAVATLARLPQLAAPVTRHIGRGAPAPEATPGAII